MQREKFYTLAMVQDVAQSNSPLQNTNWDKQGNLIPASGRDWGSFSR